MKRTFVTLFTLIALTGTASAQEFLVADSSSSGTYQEMVGQIAKFCGPDGLTIKEVRPTGGATANLAALVNNDVSAALLHSDVIFAMSQQDQQYQKLKTLVALYPEEIHVIALRNSGIKTGGTRIGGFGAKEVVFNSVDDLRGYKVGAAGGGVYTGNILKGSGNLGFEVVEFTTGAEVLPALDNGNVQTVIFVGGAPLKNVASLDGSKYKLLSIGRNVAPTVYKQAVINYPNLRSGAVQTLAPQALVITRQYKTAVMQKPQAQFRQCFFAHLDEMKEIPGLHKKWQAVDENDHGTWNWYELPGDTAARAPAEEVPVPAVTKKRRLR